MKIANVTMSGVEQTASSLPAPLQRMTLSSLMTQYCAAIIYSGDSKVAMVIDQMDQRGTLDATAQAHHTTVHILGTINMGGPTQHYSRTARTTLIEYSRLAHLVLMAEHFSRYITFSTKNIKDLRNGLQRGLKTHQASMTLFLMIPTPVRTPVPSLDPTVQPAATPPTSSALSLGCVSTPRCCAMDTLSASLARTRPSPCVLIFGFDTKQFLRLQLWNAPAENIPAVQH